MTILPNFLKAKGHFLLAAAAATTLLAGCGKDDDHGHAHPVDEQELITTLKLNLVSHYDSTIKASITFRDVDGVGGQNGIFTPDTLRLLPNHQYMAQLQVLNESNASNPINLTQEIKNEGTKHQFFFTPSQGLNLTVGSFDRDTNQLPLGLESTFATTSDSRGTVRIFLSHFDETPKTGTTPSGETDIDVTFPVRIQP